MSSQLGAMLYTQGSASRPENIEIPFLSNVAPSSSNVNFPLGKRWIDQTGNQEYVLTSFTSFANMLSANWTVLAGTFNGISSLGTTDALSNGSVSVSDATCLSTSQIFITAKNISGTAGHWFIPPGNITAGNFIINSTQTSDASSFTYMIVNT